MNKMIGTVLGVMMLLSSLFSAQIRAEGSEIVVYKSPTCGCCSAWIDHLKESGFTVQSYDQQNMDQVKNMAGIPKNLRSCHTAKIGGYLIEGHVPAESIKRMLLEKPDIQGLSVPGMPMGSPGMEVPGRPADAYNVYVIDREGNQSVFARY